MLFAKYLLATAVSQMLRELPQVKFVRHMRNRARRARIVRMKRLRAWHVKELHRLDPNTHMKLAVWHRAEIQQLNHMCRLYVDEVNRENGLEDIRFKAG